MVNSWLPRLSQHSAPIKEGRSHPSSPMFKRKSRQKWTAYVLLAAAAVWLIITQFSATASFPDVESLRMFHGGGSLGEFILSNIAEMPAGDKYSQQSTLDASFENTDENNDAKSALPDGLSAALENVFSIIPDEIYRQKLMQPITLTGSRKLRELGLRSRAYKRFLEAWEKLHLFTEDDDDIYYVRDNLVPYMRAKFSQEIFPEALHRYESYRHFLTQFSTLLFPWTSPYFADHMSLHASLHHGGRGIVVLAGDNHAQFLLTSIPSLRKRGCELPIEVFYLGDRDLREDFRLELEALPGVTTRDLSIMVNDNGWRLNGWAGKPFSILLSSFREVILIDADSLFFVNPEELFDDEDYVRTGALFFKDRLISPESKREWLLQILPKPISKQVLQSRLWTGQSGHMQESGVVVVDKWKHFVTLLLVCRLNGPDRDGKQAGTAGMYNMVYGDKETFWIGWELTGDTSYAFHPGTTGIMGVVQDPDEFNPAKDLPATSPELNLATTKKKEGKLASGHETDLTICAPQLLHLGRDNRPMWFNGWLYKNKYAGPERMIGQFDVFMEEPTEKVNLEAWKLGESNMGCLSNTATREFTQEETEWLGQLITMARMKENLAVG